MKKENPETHEKRQNKYNRNLEQNERRRTTKKMRRLDDKAYEKISERAKATHKMRKNKRNKETGRI